jgi:hypothetical protein
VLVPCLRRQHVQREVGPGRMHRYSYIYLLLSHCRELDEQISVRCKIQLLSRVAALVLIRCISTYPILTRPGEAGRTINQNREVVMARYMLRWEMREPPTPATPANCRYAPGAP